MIKMGAKKKVLVVDDEPRILRFVQVSLAVNGYDVITTTSGEESLNLARTENPDVILLDILMTPMTGFDVLDRLREFCQTPVIVFTARSFIADQALKCGANGLLPKPFQPEDLVKKIEQVIDGNHRGGPAATKA